MGFEFPDLLSGELEAVKDGFGVLKFDLSGGDGIDGLGESHLDGGAVFDGDEANVAPGFEEGIKGRVRAVVAMTGCEAVVEVAEAVREESRRLALQAVGLDVAAEWIEHRFVLSGRGDPYPPCRAKFL